MIDILDVIDCPCCEDYRVHRGRTQREPDDCYPDEAVCLQGASDSNPCGCMLDRLHDMILDGQLVTEHGYFADRDWLLQVQQGEAGVDEDVAAALRLFNFEDAQYWWIPDVLGLPVRFLTIENVYNTVCGSSGMAM